MTITLHPLNETGRLLLANGVEEALMRMNASTDGLHADLDKLGIQIDRLLNERAHIIDVLSTFYRAEHSMSSIMPLCVLAEQLNPALKEPR